MEFHLHVDTFRVLVHPDLGHATFLQHLEKPPLPERSVFEEQDYEPDDQLQAFDGEGRVGDDAMHNRQSNSHANSRRGEGIDQEHRAGDPSREPMGCAPAPQDDNEEHKEFADQGKDVLVLLTDMTNWSNILRNVANYQDQIPSLQGYPGSLYSELAKRYEVAADIEGAGSITIIGATTLESLEDPVPDNTGYITEGQFYLRNGRIEPFGSLSRLKQQVNDKTRKDHRAIMDGMIQLYAQFKESQEKKAMGFRMSSWDNKLLKYGELFESQMMDLSVKISLEDAIDNGWKILAECFLPSEVSFRTDLIKEFWPKKK